MKKIAFDLQLDEAPFFVESIRLLPDNYVSYGVTLGKRWQHLLGDINTVDAHRFYKNYTDREQEKHIGEIEQKYRISLNWLIGLDRFLCYEDRIYANNIAISLFKFYEWLFKAESVSIMYGPGIAFLTHYAAYYVAKKYNAKYIEIKVTRTPSDRFVTCDNDRDDWDIVKDIYNRKVDAEAEPSSESMGFIKKFRNQPGMPSYMGLFYQKRSLQFIHLKKVIERLKFWYVYKWSDNPTDYYTKNVMYYIKRDLKKILKAKTSHVKYDEVNAKERFILFPLHFQPEASSSVMAKYYEEQISTLFYISKSLPRNVYLYVKEHKSSIGTRAKYFYDEIKKIQNVKLISPAENTFSLIQDAEHVIVLTSTVGWEALLYGKKPIVMGNVFYNATGLTILPGSYDELTEYLVTYGNDNTDYLLERNVALYLDALNEGTYNARFGVPGLDHSIMEQENIQNFTNELVRDIELRK